MNKINPRKTLAVISLAGLSVILTSSAAAATPTISKAYNTESTIVPGSIVRLLPGSKNTVATANLSKGQDLIGVAEPAGESLLAIDQSSGTLQVAISGEAETLVSTVNGNIKQGDYVAVSPFGGMGMGSSPGDYDIGIALESFSSKSASAKQQSVSNEAGQKTTVWTGEIPVNIAIGTDNSGNNKLNSLQKLTRSLTGRTIPTVRVVIALILAILAFTILVTLTYSATYSSIISIGRNPLAKFEILKSLRMIVLSLIVVALVASLLIYLLLS